MTLSVARMRSSTGVRAAVLGWIVGCTPVGEVDAPPEAEVETAPADPRAQPISPRADAPPIALDGSQPRCGHLELQPAGPWEEQGERLAEVWSNWHPRAEHGRPVAIRTMAQPMSLPGFEVLQVQVEGSPRALQSCWVSKRSLDGGFSALSCLDPEVLIAFADPSALPRKARPWAELVGVGDQATAVFASEDELDRCVAGLPRQVRAAVPPLGWRRTEEVELLTFVEWIDAGETSMLLTVHATLKDERLELRRTELLTFERGGLG